MNPKREHLTGYLFLSPSLIGFIFFILFPVVFSFYLSFSEWDLVSGLRNMKFVGLDNYLLLLKDSTFLRAFQNNVIYTIVVVPVTMLLALLLAIILNEHVFAKGTLRLVFFMPYITTVVAVSVVWMALYHPSQGPINQILTAIGVSNPPGWLSSPHWSLASIILMMIWVGLGYDLIIYMAGLQSVPKDLYEAAEIDGAGKLRKFLNITVPQLAPTTFFLFVTRTIHSFEVFTPINLMTHGGPGDSTNVLVYYVYVQSFQFYKFGYGSAVAWVLFLIIFLVTLAQWRRQRKWSDD